MSREMTVQECDHAVSGMLPALPCPEQQALATLVSSVVLEQEARVSQARQCGQSRRGAGAQQATPRTMRAG